MVTAAQAIFEVGKLQANLASLEKQLLTLQALDDTQIHAEAIGGPDYILHHSLGYAGTSGIFYVNIKHKVTHHIETEGPLYALNQTIGPRATKIAKQEFQHMLELGIVRPLSSNWASPFHMVP